jgi:nucleoside-diphosphate-sugar epimerase
MRLLVTGGSGFIGRNFLRSLPRDWEVCAPYLSSEDFPEFLRANDLTNVSSPRIDLTRREEVAALQQNGADWDGCVYFAANGDPARSVREPALDLASNALSVVNVLEGNRFGTLIYFSSGAVYDGLSGAVSPSSNVAPLLPYAISKLAAEYYLQHFRKHGSIRHLWAVRFFGAFGPYEPPRKIYNRLVRQFAFRRDPQFTIRGDGRNLIDAMYVDDTVRAIHLMLERPELSTTVDLGSQSPISLTELVERSASTFGLEARITYEGAVPEYIQFHTVDQTMRERLGFTPSLSLEEGLRAFADHLRSAGVEESERQAAAPRPGEPRS